MPIKEVKEREEIVEYLVRVQPEPLDFSLVLNSVLAADNARDMDSNLISIFDQDDPRFLDNFTQASFYAAALGARAGNPKRLKPEETDVELSQTINLTTAKEVSFKYAVGLLKNRVAVTKYYYDDLPKDLRALSFYVSGLEKLREIELIKTSLSNAFENGLSFQQWKNSIDLKAFEDLSAARLETVYRNNINTVYNQSMRYNAGTSDVTPYLQYSAVGDSVTRPQHLELDGTIKKADSDFWDRFMPPIGHNCRCSVINLTEEEALDLGVSRRSIEGVLQPDEGFGDRDNKTYGNVLNPTRQASEKALKQLPNNSPYRSRFQNSIDNVGKKVDIWWEGVKNNFEEQ